MDYTEFSEILKEVTEELKLCTIKEAAYIMGRDDKTVYGYRAGVTQPNWDDAVRFANWLRQEHDYYKMSMQTFLTPGGGRADGRVTDNTRKIIEACVDINRSFPDDTTGCQNALGQIKEHHDILIEEVKKAHS
jgi:hypothetical protein